MGGCGASRRYIYVFYCDMFSVVNVYLDHLKFCVVCIDGRRYVCCSECYVVSNECDEPTSCLVQLSMITVVKLCTLGVLALGVRLISRIVMIFVCVSRISSLSSSSWFLIPFMLTCRMMRFFSLLLLDLCVCVVFVFL